MTVSGDNVVEGLAGPGASAAGFALELPAAGARRANRPRVLLAEDDAAIRGLCGALLKANGFDVQAFGDGVGVLEHLKREAADLVITDLFMPECDGMELLTSLRRLHPQLKVVAISGGSRFWAGSLQAARQLGAAAVLIKPFEMAELLATINAVLGDGDAPEAEPPAGDRPD